MLPEALIFDNARSVTFEVEPETRTIRGLALPFGDVAESGGKRWTFTKGSTSWGKVKVLDGHDWSRAVGIAELSETDDGLHMTAKIARGARGDEVLSLAADGVYDGLSVGLGQDVKATLKDGVYHVTNAPILEVSLTPLPAFERAAVTSVAASAVPNQKESAMDENTEVQSPDFDALTKAISTLSNKLDAGVVPPREPNPQRATFGAVAEQSPYRFDGLHGIAGQHEFSTDLFAGLRGSGEALTRVNDFISATFAAVSTGNVDEVNPVGYRPDLYVDYIAKAAPVYAAIHSGGLSDGTPFVVPKFNSAADLVDDHVEGVEPDDASFTTTSQTVTPTAISGQAKINREVIDAGGNPVVSALIWKRMNQAYAEALETKAAALLNGATLAELGATITAGDTDPSPEVEAALAGAVFIDGSGMWNFALMHRELFTVLAALKDTTGRPRYPILAPQNANGTTANKFKTLNIGGYEFTPAGSLGAVGTAQKSYIGSTEAVGFWNSAPQRIELAQTVATVGFGLFGYVGSALLDANKLRKITFDSTA